MTWFCALATGGIFLSMTLLCLFLSEGAIKDGQYHTFLSDVNAMVSYLEDYSVISERWIARMEGTGRLLLGIYDNGMELLRQDPDGVRRAAEEKALEIALREHELDISDDNLQRSGHVNFPVRVEGGESYYASVAVFPKRSGNLGVVLLYPLDRQREQITRQRWLFAGIDLMGLTALAVFAWFFTGKLLIPLEESRQRQVQFVASASHELRSPLAVMLSNLSALEKAGEGERERFQNNIREEGTRMSRLVDDMLTLASTDSRSWTLRRVPAEMDTLCLDVYERFCGPARERGLRLTVSLPEEELPPYSCDPDRVAQALCVLLDNALSYTPAGGEVSLSLERQAGGKLCFRVSDTGPGVPDGEKEKIFQRFYRTDRSRRDKEHFGLGLCIAREIVELHRGRLWVEDAPGGGAAFYMLL